MEFYIGAKNLEKKTGGRIDILINDGNSFISIENKIYAKDQEFQIERYCNFNKKKNTVLYLTLNGTIPTKESCGDLIEGKDFYCISYSKDIIKWLKVCQKESTDSPILRETIKQYIILIKRLTNQAMNEVMKTDYEKIFSRNPEFVDIAEEIFNEAVAFKKDTADQIIEKLHDKINGSCDIGFDNGLEVEIEFISDSDGFQLCINYANEKELEKHKNIIEKIKLNCENYGFEKSGAPICWKLIEGHEVELENTTTKELVNLLNNEKELNNIVKLGKKYFKEFKKIITEL